ncbi:MAG: nucleotide sugar dehydrogenase [Dehalococcoidia bacterium]
MTSNLASKQSPLVAPEQLSTPLAALRERLQSRTATVAVVGQGYVGFPLAQRIAEKGFPTLGLDSSADVEQRCRGMNVHSSYRSTSDPSGLADADIVVVAVPTPTIDTETGRFPDLGNVRAAMADIERHPRNGGTARLVIVESTYAPGTTRSLVHEFFSEFVVGDDIAVGYSPERIDPGNAHYSVDNIPKVVSGLDEASLLLTREFYDCIVDDTIPATSVEAAEACKLLENTFRFINITFAQEFEEYCSAIGVNAREATNLAATKPFGFMRFFAGAGIGGHCIAEDPYFLFESMRQASVEPKILASALSNHELRAASLVGRVAARLGGLDGKRILLLGVSYKPDVADTRRSPASPILRELLAHGAQVAFHDPLVPFFEGRESTSLESAELRFDMAIVIASHTSFDVDSLRCAGLRVFDPAAPLED